jgi:hypothetical protein
MEISNSPDLTLGTVLDTGGDRALCRLDLDILGRFRESGNSAEQAASSIGGIVKIAVSGKFLIGTLTEMKADRNDPCFLMADVEYIGEGPAGSDGNLAGFRRGITLYPHPGDTVELASPADLEWIFSPHGVAHVEIGTIALAENVRAAILYDRFLSRHFAIVGATGTGKSTAVAMLLSRIFGAMPHSHIVILDPHGEYAHAFGAAAKVWGVDNLRIPYWLMNLQEHCETFITSVGEARAIDTNIMAKCLTLARSRNHQNTDRQKITADSPVPYHLDDLLNALNEQAGRLEKEASAHHYTRIRLNIEQYFSDHRYKFIFDERLGEDRMGQLLGDLLRIPVAGQPISIIDIAGVPTEIVKVVVSIVARLIFDHAVWTPHRTRVPILLVCEEAHRYLPNTAPTDAAVSVERQLERVAREGRKYGVSLGLITQRPSELSETALSQCGTIIAMRLNNLRDQAHVKAILPEGARSFVDIIPALQNQECVIAGEGVPVPMHVRIDTITPDEAPASQDPVFSERWKEEEGEAGLAETIARWREER